MDSEVILDGITRKAPNKQHRNHELEPAQRTDGRVWILAMKINSQGVELAAVLQKLREVEKVVMKSNARIRRIEEECLDNMRKQVATLQQLLRGKQNITKQYERRFGQLAVEAQQSYAEASKNEWQTHVSK
ncbi:hypothetical protein BZA77DRAFT_291161 [Pyronema omphalodes]|nr:hypothetical protein BZA77DRAFT_291161 [Pyronema omphalodes]